MYNKKTRYVVLSFVLLVLIISVALSSKIFFILNRFSEISSNDLMCLEIANIIFVLFITGLCIVDVIFMIEIKKSFSKIKELNRSKNIDVICNINNMNSFITDAEMALKKRGNNKFAVVHLDIDKFNLINDKFGHISGDEVLWEVGQLLKDTLKNDQIYCRTYADNFLILFKYKSNQIEIVNKIYSIYSNIENLNICRALNIKPIISVGIYFIFKENCDIRIAIDKAKLAKKSIKGGYKSNYAIYDESMRDTLIEEKKIEDDMYFALRSNEFKVYLQPKINLLDGYIAGAEALVRWDHPTLGFMPPIKFIPIFEKNGFITMLDKYVFEHVCICLRKWLDEGYDIVPVSVNVSRLHFQRNDFVKDYKEIKDKYNIPKGLIEIEITESVVFGNTNEIFSIMKNFRDNGFNISMDDFGSGYSSLGLLREIPIDTLKLDKTFLEHIEEHNARIIVSNVVNLAKILN